MRHLFVLAIGIGLLPTPASAQQAAAAAPWKPSSLSPVTLARQADASMASMKNIFGQIKTAIIFDGSGTNRGWVKVKDSKTFNINFPDAHYPRNGADVPFSGVNLVANGKTLQYAGSGKGSKRLQMPLSAFAFNKAKKVADWVTGFPRYILGGIRGEAPLSSLVSLARRPGSGFTTSVSERTVKYGKYNLKQYQLLILRTPAQAKKIGPVRIELNIDGARKLPVSAQIGAQEAGHKPLAMAWIPVWRPKIFEASEFVVPKLHK
ncbi:hypothetical protein [Fimbriimonas ginsengisoli]|uniref:Uncharacterized protein n=1 Tax=Fimbriimonas ginsengisoli Gsoil 348 TaxID=661478 RepID=A0A068NXE2_FIMGI|nr:hypothetical protein [Fimbriimonas ginsengisoli]AIE86304.1 hypothetical protein OP10G_2936 [Fimbriimonas ginsengisoli Gsoil 348]